MEKSYLTFTFFHPGPQCHLFIVMSKAALARISAILFRPCAHPEFATRPPALLTLRKSSDDLLGGNDDVYVLVDIPVVTICTMVASHSFLRQLPPGMITHGTDFCNSQRTSAGDGRSCAVTCSSGRCSSGVVRWRLQSR